MESWYPRIGKLVVRVFMAQCVAWVVWPRWRNYIEARQLLTANFWDLLVKGRGASSASLLRAAWSQSLADENGD